MITNEQERIDLTKKISSLLKGQATHVAKEILESLLNSIDSRSTITS